VCRRDAAAISLVTKVRHEVFAHFQAFDCQDEFFMSNPLDVKENDERALELALHLSRLFQSALN
jgi:hypothetical protein